MYCEGLGLRIKGARQARGWTQGELAKHAEVSRSYLAQLEGSTTHPPIRTPSLRILRQLAQALRVTVEELVQ